MPSKLEAMDGPSFAGVVLSSPHGRGYQTSQFVQIMVRIGPVITDMPLGWSRIRVANPSLMDWLSHGRFVSV